MTSHDEEMVALTGLQDDGTETVPAQAPGGDDLVIRENVEAGVFEAELAGRTVAGIVYRRSGGRVTLLATSVFPEFRGQGLGVRILTGVLDMLRAQGAAVSTTCPFATAFVAAHPEWDDILDPVPARSISEARP